jgi:Holliday junction resolvase
VIIPDIKTAPLTVPLEELKQSMRDELKLSEEEIRRTIEFADRAKAPLDEFVGTMIRHRDGKD